MKYSYINHSEVKITLRPENLKKIREMDARITSYNVEMTELTGGIFWKPYTPEQITGTEKFPFFDNMDDLMGLMKTMLAPFPPIDLQEPKIRALARALGPCVIRYSGTWATRTYYDFDGHTGGKAPEGFESVLNRQQWDAALDFAKAVNAEILVSVANCKGVHQNGQGKWLPEQAELLWNYTESRGMKISYAEFMNEPNLINNMGLPDGYGAAEFARDHDLFARWLKENHPDCWLVGHCAADNPRINAAAVGQIASDDILKRLTIYPDIFSYHSYAGISERGRYFGHHFEESEITGEEYLGVTMEDMSYAISLRDRYIPGADIWATESGDAGCGGNTWASTYVEAIRYLDEIARFAARSKGIVFHNTLASSDYGFLDRQTHLPRPQY